ncbi:30S ribosome-binding factor RbfA [bacterium]|nr:30S ribosome-binding factor RbfA [bacterium]
MKPRRLVRLRELFIEELSNIIHSKVRDPRLGFITITDVEISPDLEHAKVFVSVLEGGEVAQRTLEGLENAAGFIRYELKKNIKNLRTFPVLSFHLDDSLRRGSEVIEALRKLHKDE